MGKRILKRDFTLAPELQHNSDASYRGTKVFIENQNNSLWYIKPTEYLSMTISQLLGSKIYKHFLGEHASTDILVQDETQGLYIASKQIPGFKTLNHVGDLCDGKKIVGIEKLYPVWMLLDDKNNEHKNLGVTVQEDQCVATKVDADESLQSLKTNYKNHFNNYIYDNPNYFDLSTPYFSAFQYKALLDQDQNTISLGIFYQHQEINEVKMDTTVDLDTIDQKLKAKIFSQLNDHPDYIIINTLESTRLLGQYTQGENSNVTLMPPKDQLNIDELLRAINDVVKMDASTIREIVHETIKEVKLYFSLDQLSKESEITSFEILEDGYIDYIRKNQEALKRTYDSIERYQLVEKCYEVGINSGLHEYDSFAFVKQLHDSAADIKTKEYYNVPKPSQDDTKLCIDELNYSSEKSIVNEWCTQSYALSTLSAFEFKAGYGNHLLFSALQFTNLAQVEVLKKLKSATPIPQGISKNWQLDWLTKEKFHQQEASLIKVALQFDSSGIYQGKDSYAKEFFATCNPTDYHQYNCANAFDVTKLSGEDHYALAP